MPRSRLVVLGLVAAGLVALPLAIDLVFVRRLGDAAAILARPPIPPARMLGAFQAVELVLLAAYLGSIRAQPLRLVLALGVLATAALGLVTDLFFHALRPHSFYGSLTARLEWVAAGCTLAAVAGAALGNLIVRRPRSVYVPPTALLVGSAAGMLFGPLLGPGDPRLFTLDVASVASRRFSAAEVGWLLAAGWTTWLYLRDRSAAWIERAYLPAIRRGLRQLAAAQDYARWIRAGGVEVVDRAFERSLAGTGLAARREGRRYEGIPAPEAARWRLNRLGRRMRWTRYAAATAISAGVVLFLTSVLIP